MSESQQLLGVSRLLIDTNVNVEIDYAIFKGKNLQT